MNTNDSKKTAKNYESKVYQLLNDVYRRNPNANYKGEDAYINVNHDLNNSYDNIEGDLLDELLEKVSSQGLPSYLFDRSRWKETSGRFENAKFSQENIEIGNLHFKDPNIDDIKEHTFFTNIDGIIFNNDYAILGTNLYESLYFLNLYKLEDGKYKSIALVNYPPSSQE